MQSAAKEQRQHGEGALALEGQGEGAFKSPLACSLPSQFPARTPPCLMPGTRSIAAAVSGAGIPLSAISRASLRTGERRRLIVDGASDWASSQER